MISNSEARAARIGALLLLAALAWACDEQPGDYEVYRDKGTGQWVIDNPGSGITWLRCPVGQEWDTEVELCAGTEGLFDYATAKGACPAGFSWPGDRDFSSVLCDPVDISNCDAQYKSCADCSRCRMMFRIDLGRYPSASSDVDGLTVYDFGTGCANWGGDPQSTNTNVRCVKD